MKKNQFLYQLFLAVALVIAGVTLILTAFTLPPTGEIHPSVLGAFGEILTFAGALLGMNYKYKNRQP